MLGKIESTTPYAPGTDQPLLGLQQTLPTQMVVAGTFDTLSTGTRPTTTAYALHTSTLGLQGYLFSALFHVGFHSKALLWGFSGALTALAVAVFAVLLGRRTRWSFAAAFVIDAVASPWLVAAARNLCWVPWTWFLPAIAVLWSLGRVRTSRRARNAGLAVLALAFVVRWACGYEFITCFTMMAMPILAATFRTPDRAGLLRAAKQAFVVGVVAVATFLAVAAVQVVVGRGNIGAGVQVIAFEAAKRMYGGVDLTSPEFINSTQSNPVKVLGIYFFEWHTDVLNANLGVPLHVEISGASFSSLLVAVAAVLVTRAWRGDAAWRRTTSSWSSPC